MTLPPEAAPLWAELAPVFTRSTAQGFAALLIAAILTTGRRTLDNFRRTLGWLSRGHRSGYHRILCQAHGSGLRLSCTPAVYILRRLTHDGPVVLSGSSGKRPDIE